MKSRQVNILHSASLGVLLGEGASALFLLLLAAFLLAPETTGSTLLSLLSLMIP